MPHPQIRPVERDCRCLIRPAGGHTPTCEAEFRQKFFGSWTLERQRFYYPDAMLQAGSYDPEAQYGQAS